MSSLVSDFLINPVLRQARRFSRTNYAGDQVDPLTNQRSAETQHEVAIANIVERLEGLNEPEDGGSGAMESLSDAPLTSSPIEDNGGLEAELQALEAGRILTRSATISSAHVIPLRVASLRSEPGQVDDDVSDNPSFGVPGRFRTSSPASDASVARTNLAEGSSRRSTLEGGQPGVSNHHRTSSLPEDDGMGPLRQQIILIQSMDIPAEQKARLMHRLLTRGYSQAQEMFHAKHQPSAPSPASMISQERPSTPASLSSFIWQINGAPDAVAPEQQYTFQLSPDDLRPTYAPPKPPETDEDGDINLEEQPVVLGCRHYTRNVKLQCSACDRWYTCRLCHDEAEDHILNRKATKNMLCMVCGCAQRASEFCVGCGERTAWYYCDVCKLWDNDSAKNIYHCHDCGICRKGRGLGKDFFHCKTCGTCMSTAVEHSHKCIERVSDCDCPICGEYMFDSPSRVVFMLCGHSIHKACWDEHMKSSYKCPICSKSMINMETQFRNLDRAIQNQPMPPQFQDTKAMVSCNDCYAKSAVKYHWLGLKCAICDSYNTAQLSILTDPEVEVSLLESREVENVSPPVPANDEGLLPITSGSGLGPVRQRRHSSHVQVPLASVRVSDRFSPYTLPQRIGRSVSPVRGLGLLEDPVVSHAMETDDSAEEDDLDFWGRDERRSFTSADIMDDEMEEEEESDDDSAMDECDEDGDEEDQFELFGHR
ncbi:zf-CHY-domain-containing protein [Stipitochalara longipes BDJ]|nr:zf-CHY-domain-containing protein [Stipitochalara longipes BDJ]